MGGCTRSELRCRSGGAEFVVLGVSVFGSALIGSPSPVSRRSPSSNYVLFSSLLFLVLHLFAFLFLFWLGSATDHRPHTPTTTPYDDYDGYNSYNSCDGYDGYNSYNSYNGCDGYDGYNCYHMMKYA